MPPELDEPGFLREQREAEGPQAFLQCRPEGKSVFPVLEAHDEVVRVADDDHVAVAMAPTPLVCPQVHDIVQVDVGEQRRDDALNAKGNFCFERRIEGWRGGVVLDLRRKK